MTIVPAFVSAAATTSSTATSKSVEALPFTLKQVGPGVYAAIDGPEGKSGSNAGFVIGDNGVLVVDAFFHPEATRSLIAQIHKITDKPIRYLVNTHYHIDHTGGDQVLRDAGAIIIAHHNERAWVRTENLHLLGSHLTPLYKAQIAKLDLPDETTRHRMTIWLGHRKVVIEPALGHTGGDLMVSVPDAKLLFCGDIFWNHVSPNMIDGNVAQWIDTTNRLVNTPGAAQRTFVPGHGDVGRVADVAALEGYFKALRTLVQKERAAGLPGDALVKAALPEFKHEFGSWAAIDYFAPLQLKYMDQELSGTKRVPTPVPDNE
ncbi:MAG: MBL fold metallo-hydrolase [Sphingomonadaceae bacterium]